MHCNLKPLRTVAAMPLVLLLMLLLALGTASPLFAQFGGGFGGSGFGGGEEFGGGDLGGGEEFGGAAGFGGEPEGLSTADTAGRFEPLVRVITSTVAPDSWSRFGGPGEIQAVDGWGLVIVSQTGEVHEQIENLVAALRQARREQGAGSSTQSQKDKQPRKPASLLIGDTAETAASKKIEAALAGETSLECIEKPLAGVVRDIQDKHHIAVQLDTRALDSVGLGSDTPITRSLSGVSLRSVLRLILRDLDLTYMIRDEVLLITTPEEAEAQLITRVYKVQDLALPPQVSGAPESKDE